MQKIQTIAGTPHGDTQAFTLSDTARSLSDLGLTLTPLGDAKVRVLYALITVEDNSLRVGFGSGVSASVGHKWSAGDMFVLEGADEIRNAKFINETVGLDSKIQVSIEY